MPTPQWQLGLVLGRGRPYAALWVHVGPPEEFKETGDARWYCGNVVMDGPNTPVVFDNTEIELLPVFRTSVPYVNFFDWQEWWESLGNRGELEQVLAKAEHDLEVRRPRAAHAPRPGRRPQLVQHGLELRRAVV